MRAVIVVAFILATLGFALQIDLAEQSRRYKVRMMLHEFRSKVDELKSDARYLSNIGPAIAPGSPAPDASWTCTSDRDPLCVPLERLKAIAPNGLDDYHAQQRYERDRRLREIERRVEQLLIRRGVWVEV